MIRKAGTTASTPMCGRMPHSGAMITPANAASMVPSTNTHTRSRVRSMPSACTISLSCAPALTMAPKRVRSTITHTPAMAAMASAAAQKR